jgi:hypothetical protein
MDWDGCSDLQACLVVDEKPGSRNVFPRQFRKSANVVAHTATPSRLTFWKKGCALDWNFSLVVNKRDMTTS